MNRSRFSALKLSITACILASAAVSAFASGALVELRIGMGLAKPPYIMKESGGGLDYEIAEKALARAGYKMIPLQYPPARALGLMRANKLDGILSVAEGIGGNGYFSRPYVTYHNVAISLTKNKFTITRIADLADHSLGSFQNARMLLGPDYGDMASAHTSYHEYADQTILNRLLYTGRIDVIVGDRYIFRHLDQNVGSHIDAKQAITVHKIFPLTPRQLVFRDRTVRDQFNAALTWMEQSGAIKNLYKKYDIPMPN